MTGDPAPPQARPVHLLLGGALFVALAAVPLFSVSMPPLGDYPNHLARMHVLAAHGASEALQQNYSIHWQPVPFLAMDVLVPPMARLVGVELAGRVFLLLAVALQIGGTVALHRALTRTWSLWPLLAGLCSFGFLVQLGYANFVFGAGLAMLAFAFWVACSGWPAGRRIAVSVLAGLLVYLSHYVAFLAYGLSVLGWEARAWFATASPPVLLRRLALAGASLMLPLLLFATQGPETGSALTAYASLAEQAGGLLAPFRFPGSRVDILLAGFLAAVVVVGLATRLLALDRRMVPVLALVGLAALAMPQWVQGVWGMQHHLPLVWVLLGVAALRPARRFRFAPGVALAALALFAAHTVGIAWSWQPRGRQYDELRAALRHIPVGARLLPFRVTENNDPAIARGAYFTWAQMPALAVIERDVFLPVLHKQLSRTVRAAPGTAAIDTPHGHPATLQQIQQGADPVLGPASLGQHDPEGRRNFWGGWPQRFDHALELHFGATAALPPALAPVHRGSFFTIHRVVRPE